MATTTSERPANRLLAVDALRGIAATMVMVFHYSTRFGQMHGPWPGLGFEFQSGALGVQLFFMISGFVIFMTLDRATHPSEFVVSRFSRLYPVFWVAVLVTGLTELGFHVLRQDYTGSTVLLNLLMFHGLLRVPDIDGAYWTLLVELLFYLCMLAVWLLVGFAKFRGLLAAWLTLAFLVAALPRWAGIKVPYVLSEFLVLQYIPWFAVGMILFMHRKAGRVAADLALLGLALACVAAAHTVWVFCVTLGCAALLAIAVIRPPSILLWRPVVWMGAISYPLYLVHENLGYTVMILLGRLGWGPWACVLVAMAGAIGLASLLHVGVERPAMVAIRSWYRQRAPATAVAFTGRDRLRWRVGLGLVVVALVVVNRVAVMR